MSSVSPKQHNFMEAIAHNPEFAKKAGVSQTVGEKFELADAAAGITKNRDPTREARIRRKLGAIKV